MICTNPGWARSETLDVRGVAGVRDVQPSLVGADPSMHTELCFFLHFLPLEFFKTTILQAKKETLSDPFTWDEFLGLMAILLLLGTIQGVPRRTLWSNDQATNSVVPNFVFMRTYPGDVLRWF